MRTKSGMALCVMSLVLAVLPLGASSMAGGESTSVTKNDHPSTVLGASRSTTLLGRASAQHALRGATIYAYPHRTKTKKPLRPLDRDRTGRRGGFTLHIGHNRSLLNYAQHHKGRLNVDLVVWRHHHRQMFARAVTMRYRSNRVNLHQQRLHIVAHRRYNSSTKFGSPMVMRDEVGGASYPSPTVLRVESARDVVTTYQYGEDTSSTMSAGYGISADKWGTSGEITIGGSSGATVGGTLKVSKPRAVAYHAPLKVTQELSCYTTYSAPSLGSHHCTYETVGSWNGDLNPERVKYRSCNGSVYAKYFTRGHNNPMRYVKTEGRSLASSVYVGAFGGYVNVKTGFSSNSSQIYEFNRPGQPGYYYCIGGDNANWNTSSRVFVQTSPRASKAAARLLAAAGD